MQRSLLALPDRKLGFCLAFLLLPLLFLPKISLVQIRGETAGIRVDDIILLGFSIFFLLIRLFRANGLLKIEKIFSLLILSSIISFFINRAFEQSDLRIPSASKIIYTFRLIEYFLFFYVGFYLSRVLNLSNFLFVYLCWIGCILIFQKIHLIGEFSGLGYRRSTSRPLGISTFPAEMGIILNMLFAYFLFHTTYVKTRIKLYAPRLKQILKNNRIYILFLSCFFLIIITGARVAILSILFTFIFFIINKRRNFTILLFLIPFAITLAYILIYMTQSIYHRTNLLSWQNFTLFSHVWNAINLNDTMNYELILNLNELDVDMSLWMRLQKWLYFIKHFVHSPQFWLFGFGPGTCGAALDGSILRIFLEGGIVGSALFILFFYAIYRQTPALKWIVINYAINMIFFDAHLAYKAMSLLLFISGYYKALESREQNAASDALAMA